MNVSDFEALPADKQAVVLAGLQGDALRDLRARVRMMRLGVALKKAEANLKNPGYPKAKHKRCAERIAEFTKSMKNLAEHGVETIATGNPIGTQIDVPLGKLGKTASAPSA